MALAGCASSLTGGDPGYEIWALDQGRNIVYIYEPEEDGDSFEEVDSIDFNEYEAEVPHMIAYSSDYEYAAIACTAGQKTVVVRTEDKEVVEVLETGGGSHMAGFSPDDEYIHVDVIGENKIVRIDADLDDEEFEIVDEIVIAESDAAADHGGDFENRNPICHSFTQDERYSYHTLGPSYNNAGLVIVDHDDFSIEKIFHGDDDGIPTNCGTMPHPTESKFYLTAGLPAENVEDGVGEYYIFDTEDHTLIDQGSTGGVDAHGFWFTTDGEELWVLNRQTDDGIILDPDTDDVIDEIDDYGRAPDIMWASPDGEFMFVTLRGPEQQSGSPHAASGETPGFTVLDVEDREIVELIEPDSIDNYSEEDIEDDDVATPDFHGIGVRPLGDYSTGIPTSPPF
nr:cell surface protein [Natronobiforma cellulositropha]